MVGLANSGLRLDATPLDYAILGAYFAVVLGIGIVVRRRVRNSLDFFLSGRSMPAWITGIAFVMANLGAIELIGMTANGAQYGLPTLHYYLIGAIPAMVFLGLVMMPFYYGSKVRSVPEFLRRRFGPGAHLFNALSFTVASLLIAGVNLYALALIVNVLLGWPIAVSIVVAAALVLSYITLGGLTAAIYTEVMQFFVLLAGLVPMTVLALREIGGWQGLVDRIERNPGSSEQLSAWPGTELTGLENPVLSVIGIVFGLGFVLSFGYWTTNFAEVQRAMSAKDMSAAKRTPLIGAYPKILVPVVIVLPGMIAGVLSPELAKLKAGESSDLTYNDALPYLMAELLPTGFLGIAVAGLMASFMAGMAANISSFNTVFTYDLWQDYVVKGREDGYYLSVGRWVTVIGSVLAVGTAFIAAGYSNIMDYIQALASIFNAPLFATFIIGMFWKRMTPAAGWSGLVAGTAAALAVYVASETGVLELPGQGASFLGASLAFVLDALVTVLVTLRTRPKPQEELVGLVYGLGKIPADGSGTDRIAGAPEAAAVEARTVTEGAGGTETEGEGTTGKPSWYRRADVLGVSALVLAALCYVLVG
ncbi:sodium:solute symporter family protein [Streptomyces oceani]|uniref:Na+/galactose cotransporter n=1 Tax=Streptomyces oceani TaxID=1075402 RepID=A0A1E7KFN1_9ACTN|nr:sodium:solute symporter family protein [Streptomyces oceani]OEV02739.1 Na+/galactose cotransporter [Streptomyces oceani]